MTPVGCAVGPPITCQLNLEGIPVFGLITTGASVTCMGFSLWWQYHPQWGPLKPFEGVVHGTHSKPLQIAGETQHLNLQWGKARGRASFILIIGLESPPYYLEWTSCVRCASVSTSPTEQLRPRSQIHKPFISTPPKHRTFSPPAVLYCYKASTSPPKQRACSVAITHGLARTSTSAQRKASLRLCPGCPRLPVYPKCGSRSTITEPLHLHTGQIVGTLEVVAVTNAPPPALVARLLSTHTCRPLNNSS